jgi:long-chain acyl-CoA synthetase
MTETLVSNFFDQAERLSGRAVLKVKRAGAYGDVLWGELSERVTNAAAGLLALGVEANDRVGILSENRQEWIEADFACMSVGGITVALHAPLTAAQVREQLADAGPAVVFVSTVEQRDKLQSVLPDLPSVRQVITFEEAAAASGVISHDALLKMGRARLDADPGCVERRSFAVTPPDLAAICYTSGTTGESKGVMLTHHNLTTNIRAIEDYFPLAEEATTLLYLPLSHIYARTCDLYYGLATGRIIALAESVDTVAQNLQEVRPHHISGVPRVHQKFVAAARTMIAAGNKDALRLILGGRIQYVGSGGAALPPETAQFYFDHGVPVYQGYGLTETSPVISFNYPGKWNVGSAGIPIKDIEVRIADDGEILTRGPHVMKGYWNKPEATAEAIDPEGWFHTGDIGRLDDEGFLYITDRKKEIIVTSYGKNIAPQLIEGLLANDPYIEQAMVYGDGKPCLTALIVPAAAALQAWAKEKGLSGDLEAVIGEPVVRELYRERIDGALKNLSQTEQIKGFILLAEPFSAARGEMTVTAKLRRRPLVERYRGELEALYNESLF